MNLTSRIVPLKLDNIDTDQIIPARFLKATSREGFGENLFRDWRYDKEGNVRIRWTHSNTGKKGVMTLTPHELIRRWLLHVLPKGLMRVRHYGYLSPAAVKTRLLSLFRRICG